MDNETLNLLQTVCAAGGARASFNGDANARLEQLVEDLLDRSLEPCKKALADAGLQPSQPLAKSVVGQERRPAWRRRSRPFRSL